MFSYFFFFSSRRRHTRWNCDWSSDVCSSDLIEPGDPVGVDLDHRLEFRIDCLDGLECRLGKITRADLAAFHQASQAQRVISGILLKFHCSISPVSLNR